MPAATSAASELGSNRMPERLRVFISSPGDVPDERLQAGLVVDKLSQDYGRFFSIETYRWEYEPMLASGHFQDAIEPPSAFDIVDVDPVVAARHAAAGEDAEARISRDRRPHAGNRHGVGIRGGAAGGAGARRARHPGVPQYRSRRRSTRAIPMRRSAAWRSSTRSTTFWRRHFADRGVFLAAYDEYRTLEDFSRQARGVAAQADRAADQGHGSGRSKRRRNFGWACRSAGCESYEFEHAAIFFGRDGLVAKAAEQLAGQARAGTAFLLVSGASGSGKSSLVKAALCRG